MKKIILSAAFCILSSISIMAQTSASGYFLDGYLYRHQMNPAIGNSKNFISLPGIGNVNASVGANTSVKNMLYNIDGNTATFLHPKVSEAEFLSNLKDNTRLDINARIGIISAGFKGFGGYNNISVNLRSDVKTNISNDVFRLMKCGIQNSEYNIGKINIHANALGEVALNHSHKILPNLRIGASLKFLVGLGQIDAATDGAKLSLMEDKWTISSNAEVNAHVKNLHYTSIINSNNSASHIDGIEFNDDITPFGPAGFGSAIDLGAELSLGDFTLSAAVLDLGFINWKYNKLASTNGTKTISTDKYTFDVNEDAPHNFDDEIDKIADDFETLYQLSDMGDTGSSTSALASTINLGVEYSLPTYKALSFGLLGTARLHKNFSSTELRLSANYSPCAFFSMGANIATGTYGTGFGWMVNIHPTGFNLFAGMDYTPFELSKDGIPLQNGAKLNIGVNIPF